MQTEQQTQNFDTPMMRQFLEVKKRYPNEILFFRMGDFYEMFLEDAVYSSRVLDIALTRRQDKIPMCGFPHHSAQNYILKILQSGRNIAVCEQVEDPKTVSGRIVKRDVIRVLTPGSIFEEDLLDQNERRLLTAVFSFNDKIQCASADLSTGEVFLEEIPKADLDGFLSAKSVREIVTNERTTLNHITLPIVERPVRPQPQKLISQMLQTANIDSVELQPNEISALGLLFQYIQEIVPQNDVVFRHPVRENRSQLMLLDEATLKTLEILQDQSGARKASLSGILDNTQTTAGRRLLNDWLARPSLSIAEIKQRYDVVDFFLQEEHLADHLRHLLSETHDLSRLTQILRQNPEVRHLGQLHQALICAHSLRKSLSNKKLPTILTAAVRGGLTFPDELFTELQNALLTENLPPLLDERRFIRAGYSNTLDNMLYLSESAQKILHDFEENERQKHGISTLKIRYNKILGYFFEISKGMIEKAPAHYVRRQTLTTCERYTSQELQELENKILSAKDNVIQLQKEIFETLCAQATKETDLLQQWAELLAKVDVLLCFAKVSVSNKYIRPEIHQRKDKELILKESRHPVVEQIFHEEVFVPNDVSLNCNDSHLAILTGPNMAGKSTYIRQIGLAVIMAQAGCFVPASQAVIPLTDRVFTRIGAYDRLFRGESTFYVEMAECARIFANFTKDSLILLDEVGRGTSTYDGISIARAMIEYLNDPSFGRPKTLFATHYAELAGLIETKRGILGLTVSIQEHQGKVIFLRKIGPGTANKSYGIHVAELAGVPNAVIQRARVLLDELEKDGLWQAEPTFREINKAQKSDEHKTQLGFSY